MTRWTQEQADEYIQRLKNTSDKGPAIEAIDEFEGPESDLQKKCNKWLDDHGFPFIHDRSRGKNKSGKILDLHIYLPKGRHVIIELKTKGNTMTDDQKKTFQKLIFLGHEVYEARSFKRFLEIMEGN